jgi:hypothetical protein
MERRAMRDSGRIIDQDVVARLEAEEQRRADQKRRREAPLTVPLRFGARGIEHLLQMRGDLIREYNRKKFGNNKRRSEKNGRGNFHGRRGDRRRGRNRAR